MVVPGLRKVTISKRAILERIDLYPYRLSNFNISTLSLIKKKKYCFVKYNFKHFNLNFQRIISLKMQIFAIHLLKNVIYSFTFVLDK